MWLIVLRTWVTRSLPGIGGLLGGLLPRNVEANRDTAAGTQLLGGLQLAQTALRPAVVDFVQLATSSDNLDLNMEQVQIADGAPLAGRSIIEANLRQRFGVVVVGIQRASGAMEFNPPPESIMRVGDYLVVLGQAKNLRDLEAVAGHAAVVR
jgi:voltage-gated potassium channel